MNQVSATVVSILAASAVSAGCFAIAFPLSGSRDLESVAGTFAVAFFFTTCAAAIIGFPLFLALNRLGLVRWWSATLCGALVGIAAVVVVRFSVQLEASTFSMFAVLGGMAGLVFWAVRQAVLPR